MVVAPGFNSTVEIWKGTKSLRTIDNIVAENGKATNRSNVSLLP
jgi:hypothetical protein